MFNSWDIQLFNHCINSKIKTSWWVCSLVFEYILWTRQKSSKFSQLIDIVMINIFRKMFAWIARLSSKFRPFLIYQPTTIIKNRSWLCYGFLLFWRYTQRWSKMNSKVHLPKTHICHFVAILSKIKKSNETSFQTSQYQ